MEDPYETTTMQMKEAMEGSSDKELVPVDELEDDHTAVDMNESTNPSPAALPPTTAQDLKPTTARPAVKVTTTAKPAIALGGIFDEHKTDETTMEGEMEPLAIPIWVWILVAIIGIIVILCIVLVMTRCIRRGNGRTIYAEP